MICWNRYSKIRSTLCLSLVFVCQVTRHKLFQLIPLSRQWVPFHIENSHSAYDWTGFHRLPVWYYAWSFWDALPCHHTFSVSWPVVVNTVAFEHGFESSHLRSLSHSSVSNWSRSPFLKTTCILVSTLMRSIRQEVSRQLWTEDYGRRCVGARIHTALLFAVRIVLLLVSLLFVSPHCIGLMDICTFKTWPDKLVR